MATSTSVRCTASGVRSSCEAFATKCVWLSKADASRSSIPSKVLASSFSSSSGPSRWMRRFRLSAPSLRAVAVIVCTGRSTRPAMYQDASAATPPATSSAMPEVINIVWIVDAR
ncbi:hypothetical protein SAMN05661093_10445 [Kibdelosporangium aridum]|uniref:Uncharacterized protein n=1 Tax=Kibdelosporangium aridum TaxID=2030 RepID=A0A1W2FZ08_KIBAR|nr:hypothetical protein SAMN05661093_10445 [Kibdelosporangium aridum]